MATKAKGIAISHRGNFRGHNEDAYFIGPVSESSRASNETIDIELGSEFGDGASATLLAVADGVGGCAAGELASSQALDFVRCHLNGTAAQQPDASAVARLSEALNQAHRDLLETAKQDPSKDGMATTLTCLYFENGDAYLAHIGDSRCYRFRKGRLEQQTVDHSPVGRLVADGKLSEEEALLHPYRSYIDQVLGNAENPIEPQITQVSIEKGDRWLLCSDGLSDSLYHEQIVEIFGEHAGKPIGDLGNALLEKALDRSGRDNISLLLFEVGKDSLLSRFSRLYGKSGKADAK